MITAAVHGVTISPSTGRVHGDLGELAAIASEIAERVDEMNGLRENAGTDLVLRLANIARLDHGAFHTVLAVLHGDTGALTEPYAARGDAVGRKKQTVHYRTARQLDIIREMFPAMAIVLEQLRDSVRHHEDPLTVDQIVRDAHDENTRAR